MGNSGRKRSHELRSERKKQILSAAKHLFMTQGYESTTMQQVVVEAGTSIGNCYFYFPNKEALLHAIVEDTSLEILKKVDLATEDVPPGAIELAVSFYIFLKVVLDEAELTVLVFSEKAHLELKTAFIAYYEAGLKRFFKEYPELLNDSDIEIVTTAWEGATIGIIRKLLKKNLEQDRDSVLRFLVRWNLQALGLSAQTVQDALDALDRVIIDNG
ncbi:TetR/AcrR family transcriptional regulator [Deltaproteobacteria bacterium TL4]